MKYKAFVLISFVPDAETDAVKPGGFSIVDLHYGDEQKNGASEITYSG